MSEIADKLRAHITDDHVRGCTGRNYSCDCGYDADTEKLLEEGAAEIERLTSENIDRLMTKVKLEDEIRRLQSSPTSGEIGELIEQLQECSQTGAYQHGPPGVLMNEAAEALHRLARNQITADHTTIAQAAAFQAQHADSSMRFADEQQQRAEALDYKCTQFTEALMTAMALVDELLRENVRLCGTSSEPPNVRLFTAKNSWEAAMKKLLGDEPPSHLT
jgi:hypothetical protein